MIHETVTFILFGYTSTDLSYGSSKKVLCICNECGKERLIQYRMYRDLCVKCKCNTKEYKYKISKANTGKHHSKETKCKISKARIGTHSSEETRAKISKNHADMSGENHYNWKGGIKLARARTSAKRRELFGFISHNLPQKDFHGHHLDFNHVIFIPKKLHRSIYHSVVHNINMDLINDAACNWYLKYQLNLPHTSSSVGSNDKSGLVINIELNS